jgi:NADH-quinone oxidoreductase subunit M
MGLPLLNGFVGEFTILQGAFMANRAWAAWAIPGVVLAAAYLLWLYQRVFFGKVENPKNEKLGDLNARELATFLPLVAMALWIGLYPKPFFKILDQPVSELVTQIERPQIYNANQPPMNQPSKFQPPMPSGNAAPSAAAQQSAELAPAAASTQSGQ